MTITSPRRSDEVAAPVDLVAVTIDGIHTEVPKGTLVIRAAEELGIAIPRFCDHPLLDPVGACRQCLVQIPDMGNGRGMPKPQASCTLTVMPGMVVETQLSSPVAEKAQRGVMELLLVNHPLDCPVCDKGGECPLQNQAMSNGRSETRFVQDVKRTYRKPLPISAEVLLDRERCVLCARCTRFSQQIAGDPFIELLERGALQQVGIYAEKPFESYFSGNTIQICPVGALTSASYRFKSRPYDLVSVPTTCEHCAAGCSTRTDVRRQKVQRRLAGDDPEVNEEWNCDKGRFAFVYASQPDRLTTPLVREELTGELVPASWPEALDIAARGLAAAVGTPAGEAGGVRAASGAAVLLGGRHTLEDAYAYAKFARVSLGTNDVDFRARPHSAEEADFLASTVAGSGLALTYDEVEHAPVVLLVGLEPEEEAGILYLRLRKAHRSHGQQLFALAPFATAGVSRAGGHLLQTLPGAEGARLASLAAALSGPAVEGSPSAGHPGDAAAVAALRSPGAVVLVGERLATVPGALSNIAALADAGLRVAWVPRRAGDRGAVEAGALPGLLPGGRPVSNPEARVDVAAAWGSPVPATTGRSGEEFLAAARAGALGALVVGGVDPEDLADPAAALAALAAVPFLVSLEIRHSAVTALADVVFPVATVVEKAGTFLDWEGRPRPFEKALTESLTLPDLRVLDRIADAMDAPIGLPTPVAVARELAELGSWDGVGVPRPSVAAIAVDHAPSAGEAVLASWHQLLDDGSLQAGEPHLAATARRPVVRLSPATAAEIGAAAGDVVVVSSAAGSIRLPLAPTEMADRVVWVPTHSVGSHVRRDLGVAPGTVVRVTVAAAAVGAAAGAGSAGEAVSARALALEMEEGGAR
jgi:NADH-quinone oxidoreductase subunit G